MKSTIKTISAWSFAFLVCALASTLGGDPAYAGEAIGFDIGTAGLIGIGGIMVNAQTLQAAQTSFKTLFQNAFSAVKQFWTSVAMKVPSNTSANDYKWLGELPGIRKWLGDKVVHNLVAHGYFLPNEDFELTVGVDRNDFEDDQLGIYNPLMSNLGDASARHPDELVWPALIAGFTTGKGFDGVTFFNTAHPVNGVDDADGSYANRPVTLGAGEPWFLVDDSRPVQPMILQERKPYTFVSMSDASHPNVFMQKKFLFGVEARGAVGYGLPQLIYGSRATLDAAAYKAARLAMSGLKRIDGTPLGVKGLKLVVGEGNFEAANVLLTNDRDTAGATNTWKGTARLELVDYLTGA